VQRVPSAKADRSVIKSWWRGEHNRSASLPNGRISCILHYFVGLWVLAKETYVGERFHHASRYSIVNGLTGKLSVIEILRQ
jgi:hypothetical protein